MPYRIHIPQTPDVHVIQSRAVRRFRHRYLGWTGIILGLTYLFLLLVFIAWGHWQMVAITGAVGSALLLWMAFRYCRASGSYRLARMPCDLLALLVDDLTFGCFARPRVGDETRVELEFTPQGLSLFVNDHKEPSTGAWADIAELWLFPDCWMLIRGDLEVFFPLPAHLLDGVCRELIVQGVRTAGVAIHTNPGLGIGLVFQKEYLATRSSASPTNRLTP